MSSADAGLSSALIACQRPTGGVQLGCDQLGIDAHFDRHPLFLWDKRALGSAERRKHSTH
jgi:hypothetical protein